MDLIITDIYTLYLPPIALKCLQVDENSVGVDSDHSPVLMSPHTDAQQPRSTNKNQITIRPLPDSSIRRFGQFLTSHKWEEVLQKENLDEKVMAFHNTLKNKLDEFFPTKTINQNSNLDKKWMSPELKDLHRRMQREYWKNRKSDKWRSFRHKFTKLKKKNCRSFYNNFVTDLKSTNPSKWYMMAKKIGAISNQKDELHIESLSDMSNGQAAEAIADHFAQISQLYQPIKSEDIPPILPSPTPPPRLEEYQVNLSLKLSLIHI